MKKVFAMLLSIWIPIYLMFGLLASCEKSVGDDSTSTRNPAPASKELTKTQVEKNQVVGTWRLKEFIQNIGDGHGNWIAASNAEQISFSPEGDFSANEYFPLFDRHFDKYRISDSTHIQLYSSQTTEDVTYYFQRESETSLLFNPVCRENCSRRYTFVQ